MTAQVSVLERWATRVWLRVTGAVAVPAGRRVQCRDVAADLSVVELALADVSGTAPRVVGEPVVVVRAAYPVLDVDRLTATL